MPENFDFKAHIEESETNDSIREETLDAINTAKNILNNLRSIYWKDNPTYKSALAEYEDLRAKTIGFFQDDNEIKKDELNIIRLELSQVKQISNEVWRDILDQVAFIPEFIWLTSEALESLWIDTSDLNTKQDELIEKILWSDKWYWNWYIHWFNSETWWNNVEKISDFEKKLQTENIKDINSRALANYLVYLYETNWNNIQKFTKLIKNNFWEEQLNGLINIWKKGTESTTQVILDESGFKPLIDIIKKSEIIFDSNNDDEVFWALELADEQMLKNLEQFIIQNKDNPAFKDKLTKFYEKISRTDCPISIRNKVWNLIELINSWEEINQTNLEQWLNKKTEIIISEEEKEKYSEILKDENSLNEFLSNLLTGSNTKQIIERELNKLFKVQENIINPLWSNNTNNNHKILLEWNSNSQQSNNELLNWNISKIKLIDSLKKFFEENPDKLYIFIESWSWDIFWKNQCPNPNSIEEKLLLELNELYLDNKLAKNIWNLYLSKWIKLEAEQLNNIITQLKDEIRNSTDKKCSISYIEYLNKINTKEKIDFTFDVEKDWILILDKIINPILTQTTKKNDIIITNIITHYSLDKEKLQNSDISDLTLYLETKWLNNEEIQTLVSSLDQNKELNRQKTNIKLLTSDEKIFKEFLKRRDSWEKPEDIINDLKETTKITNNDTENYNFITSEINYTKTSWGYTLLWENWTIINWLVISEEEKKLTLWNPEATENLVNFYEKLQELNLGFIWNFRKQFIWTMNQVRWTSWVESNDNDYLDPSEFLKLLNFILEAIWQKWDNSNINWAYSKIRDINWWWMLNNKKDTITWLSVIWQKFAELWFIWKWWNSFDTINKVKLMEKFTK